MAKIPSAIESVKTIENSTDLLLCGFEDIHKASLEIASAHYYGYIDDANLISSVFGLGEENQFLYTIVSFKDNNVVRYELGVGYAYQFEDQIRFCRKMPIMEGKNFDFKHTISSISNYYAPKNSFTIITASPAENYSHHFYDKNYILKSLAPFYPVGMLVKPHSLVGRLDGDLSNISLDDDSLTDYVVDMLCRYSKQLNLKTSKLNANKLAIKQLQLEPSSGNAAKKGTFIYDEETDTIKFFNGEKWRTLKWVDEEKAE
jgi:hypothetical protein